MDIVIRTAKLTDINNLDSFQHGIGIHERPLDSTIKKSGRIRYSSLNDLKKKIKSKQAIVLIAEVKGKPVGCGLAEIKKSRGDWSKYKHMGLIGMMFVKKDFRGKDVGKKIIKDLLKWLKKNKIKDIRLTVYHNNTGAINLYKKCGFRDYILEMVHRP